ncbi:MAG: chaperone modulator CbpM [Flavisolibacter sp.]
MTDGKLIPANEFCIHHNIEVSFMDALQDYGLIEITTLEGTGFIEEEQLAEIERMMRLHYDLHINFEGIDAVKHLLEQIQLMQREMSGLRNRLRLYETGT